MKYCLRKRKIKKCDYVVSIYTVTNSHFQIIEYAICIWMQQNNGVKVPTFFVSYNIYLNKYMLFFYYKHFLSFAKKKIKTLWFIHTLAPPISSIEMDSTYQSSLGFTAPSFNYNQIIGKILAKKMLKCAYNSSINTSCLTNWWKSKL